MAKKKDIQIHLRLKSSEVAPIDADRKELPGVPVGRSAYAKHALLSYPKLRKLEDLVRRAIDPGVAHELLKEAGL